MANNFYNFYIYSLEETANEYTYFASHFITNFYSRNWNILNFYRTQYSMFYIYIVPWQSSNAL